MQPKIDRFYSFAAAALLLLLWAANLLAPKREFSPNENRYLAQFPALTAKSLFSGDFQKKFEDFASDQFVARDFWVSGKAHLEKIAGKRENNGVYFASDGYLIEKEPPYDPRRVETNLEAIKKLGGLSDFRTVFLLVPTASEILKEKLPPYAYEGVQRALLNRAQEALAGSGVALIDPTDALLEHKDEYLYYRTDHHETTFAAYLCYARAAGALGLTPRKREDFEEVPLSDAFLGTTWSKAMLQSVRPDTITAFTPKFPVSFEAYFPGEDRTMEGLYAPKHLATKDKYAVFLDGNHPVVEIQSSAKTGKSLAICKDSYAHCMIPFFASHYEKIYVLDLRYYNLDPIAYLKEHKIDDILLIYNAHNFLTDVNIAKLGLAIDD